MGLGITYNDIAGFIGRINTNLPNHNLYDYNAAHFHQIKSLQNINYNIVVPENNITQLGQLKNKKGKSTPIVNLQLDYLLSNGQEEYYFGFDTRSLNSPFYKFDEKEFNLHFLISSGNIEANFSRNQSGACIVSFGNCKLDSYSIVGEPNSFIQCSTIFSALNANVCEYSTGIKNVSINYISGDEHRNRIFLPFGVTGSTGFRNYLDNNFYLHTANLDMTIGTGITFVPQSFNLSLNFNKQIQDKLGNLLPESRKLQLPIELNLDVNGLVTGEILEKLTQNIDNVNIGLIFWDNCRQNKIIKIGITGAKLVSKNLSIDLSNSYNCQLSFSKQLNTERDFAFNNYAGIWIDAITTDIKSTGIQYFKNGEMLSSGDYVIRYSDGSVRYNNSGWAGAHTGIIVLHGYDNENIYHWPNSTSGNGLSGLWKSSFEAQQSERIKQGEYYFNFTGHGRIGLIFSGNSAFISGSPPLTYSLFKYSTDDSFIYDSLHIQNIDRSISINKIAAEKIYYIEGPKDILINKYQVEKVYGYEEYDILINYLQIEKCYS